MILVGLFGAVCTGKSTAAHHLAKIYSGKVLSLASAVRELNDRLGLDRTRDNLVLIGNTMRDFFNQDIWIDKIRSEINDLDLRSTPVFIDDLRYPQEMDFIKGNGGHIIGLKSNPENSWKRYNERNRNSDTAFKTLDEFINFTKTNDAEIFNDKNLYLSDRIIENNGTKENFLLEMEGEIFRLLRLELNLEPDTPVTPTDTQPWYPTIPYVQP